MRWILWAIAFSAGCVRTSAVTCPDGSLCREGTECVAIPDGYACAGGEAACANGRVEEGEACDDGNTRTGDGCSADCRSDEVCGNGIVDPARLDGDVLVGNENCDDGGVVGHDGCSSTCVAESLQVITFAKVPPARSDTAMAADHAGRRIVMFGGKVDGASSNDTWELAGDGWAPINSPVAPAPRIGHAMVYDGSRIILFGGSDDDDDTWAFVDNTWQVIAIPKSQRPQARSDHAMAYLPGTGVVMVGGRKKEERTNETWVFANNAWTRLGLSNAPSARINHVLTLDPVRNELLLVGGDEDGVLQQDTWSFDGSAWTLRDAMTAPNVSSAVAVYDAMTDRTVLFGGVVDGITGRVPTDSTYVWDRTQWLLASTAGVVVQEHAGAVDPVTGRPVVFGGTLGGIGPCLPMGPCPPVFNLVLDYSATAWIDRGHYDSISGANATVAFDSQRQRAVAVVNRNTFELGLGSWRFADKSLPNLGGAAVSMAPVGNQHRVVLFGGEIGGTNAVNDLRVWDGTTWSAPLVSTTRPSPRANHQMVYDAKRDRMILFGGGIGGERAETWEWKGTDWRRIMAFPSPGEREGHAMAFDPMTGTVLLFGGSEGSTSSEFWSLDGDTWMRLEPTPMPGGRRGAALAWDPTRRVLVLVGGTPDTNMWEWNGTAWRFTNANLEARYGIAACTSPTGAGVIAVARPMATVGPLDTKHVVATSTERYTTCRSMLDDDGNGAGGCDDVNCWATCSPSCPPSTATCNESLPRCGDGRCDAPREHCGICSDCACVFCGDLRCDPSESATSCPGDC